MEDTIQRKYFFKLSLRDCLNPFDKRWYNFNDSLVDEININS